MDRSECKRIVEKHIDPLMLSLGIPHWKIMVNYDMPDGDPTWQKLGDCERNYDYNRAFIRLNPKAFDTEDDVLATLRHELFHVVLGPFDLFRAIVDGVLKGDQAKIDVFNRIEIHAIEKAVINLERMYHGLCEANVTRTQTGCKPMAKKASKPKSPPKPPVKKPAAPMPKGKPKKGC